MASIEGNRPNPPLIALLIEATKRADGVLDGMRVTGAKLFGAQPRDTAESMPELSVNGLTLHLISTIAQLEDELQRQHNALGEFNAPPATVGHQARASSSY